MSHKSFEIKVTPVFLSLYSVHSVDPCIFDQVTPYVAQTQPMGRRCVVYHFQVNSSKVKITQVIQNFCCVCSVTPCLFDRFTSYMEQIQPLGRGFVMHHCQVKRWKVKVTRVISSFLPCLLCDSMPIWLTRFICGTIHVVQELSHFYVFEVKRFEYTHAEFWVDFRTELCRVNKINITQANIN